MERVAVDVLASFLVTNRRNCYELMAMDNFTKWLEAYAIPSKDLWWSACCQGCSPGSQCQKSAVLLPTGRQDLPVAKLMVDSGDSTHHLSEACANTGLWLDW